MVVCNDMEQHWALTGCEIHDGGRYQACQKTELERTSVLHIVGLIVQVKDGSEHQQHFVDQRR